MMVAVVCARGKSEVTQWVKGNNRKARPAHTASLSPLVVNGESAD